MEISSNFIDSSQHCLVLRLWKIVENIVRHRLPILRFTDADPNSVVRVTDGVVDGLQTVMARAAPPLFLFHPTYLQIDIIVNDDDIFERNIIVRPHQRYRFTRQIHVRSGLDEN